MKRRISAVLLTASMVLSMVGPVRATEERGAGRLEATLRLDYSQELAELRERDVRAELLQGRSSLGEISLTQEREQQLSGCFARVTLRDRLGGDLIGSATPGALDLTVEGLSRGDYTLRFAGTGYTDCEVPFTLQNYDQYIEVGTGDGTFALGDLDGNGRVDVRDRDALTASLGSTGRADLDRFDLNGDGKIDIIDLAYVNHNANTPVGQATVLDTACTDVRMDADRTQQEMNAAGTAAEGDVESLLRGEGYVRFRNAGDIVIPITLSAPVEAQEIQVATPDSAAGAVQAGTAQVEYEEEGHTGVMSVPFVSDTAMYADIHAITRTPGSNVITISLGKRVAVKKITITVTKTVGGEYAALESIRFLRDIVPEELTEPNSQVKKLSAAAGDGQVDLIWSELPNVSGYLVEYWQSGLESTRLRLNTDVAQARITGLDNLKTYCFTVTPVDGSWQGKACTPVEAMPMPAKSPAAPDMVSVAELDGQLKLSWKAAENATWYEVYCTDQAGAPVSSYQQAGGRVTAPAMTVGGLTNGTTYYLYVVAGNDAGRSGPSRIAAGTPKATDYSRPAGIPTQGILDSSYIADIRLADAGNYDSRAYTADAPFTPWNMMDGDFRTHWTASSTATRNEHVIVTFTQPVDLSTAFWAPRMDGDFPSYLRAYSVRVWYSGEENGEGHLLTGGIDNGGGSNEEVWSWPEIPNRSNIPESRFAVLPFGPVTGVTKISIAVEQRDYYQVSLSELMFMEYDPARSLPANIDALFADGLHTRLVSGVNQEQIDALTARLNSEERNYYLYPEVLADELALARELLENKSTSGVVLEGIQSRSSAVDSKKYSQGGSELQPLGVAAKAGEKITIYAAGIPEGETVTVYATQFNAEASAWQAKAGTLVNGRNVLTIPKIGSENTGRGGSLYAVYGGSAPEAVRLHIRRAVDIPVLELSDWYAIGDEERRNRIGAYVEEITAYVSAQGISDANAMTNCLNVTEISMPSVLLSIPAAAVLGANGLDKAGKVENLYQNVLAWEDVMHICKTTQGIDRTYGDNDMTSRQNIRCMQMFAGAFMYAAGSHIGIGYKSCSGMVSGKPVSALGEDAQVNQLFGWGIAHEIGHNMDKLGRAEITNNIYSLMVQTFDGNNNTLPSRLESKYPAIFTKTAQKWPGASNNVFVQLGMYWQLHLAYDGAKGEDRGPMWFYNQFFQDWKKGTYTAGAESYDDKVALTAAGVTQRDLTEFFTRWGMSLSDSTKEVLARYEKEKRAVRYLSDQSRRDRLAGLPDGKGSVSVAASKTGDSRIDLTLSSSLSQGKLQGYEILRNGVSIGFTAEGTYTDTIGSANHRTYTYSVRAYDTLGNCFAEDSAPELRVAYDKTVPADAYDLKRGDAAVTFAMKEETAVSGLKIAGVPASGDITVTVTDGGGKTVIARSGSFNSQEGSCLIYFQKPGAAADDTRIWTYDAKTVTVTGIPETVTDIQLISYAGDDVAFLEGGGVGRLRDDYRYGDGGDEVIAQGTLVIVGTYRGNPGFLTVKLEGLFTQTTAEGEEMEPDRRYLDGYSLLLAEVPQDGVVSDISDGLFLFVPNIQREAELQGTDASHCDGVNLLPSQMRAVLSRTDLPNAPESQRVTAETMWTDTPGGADLPTIVLEG